MDLKFSMLELVINLVLMFEFVSNLFEFNGKVFEEKSWKT